MGRKKPLTLGLVALAFLATLVPTVGALPASAIDESKVPHYFGPYPNYANSPFTLPDVAVALTGGGGSGATAEATVGANGAITAITVTDPGSRYTSAPTVEITGAGTGAAATATFVASGAVTGISVDNPGGGYTTPQVAITGNGTGATATAYGSVDTFTLTDPGLGYMIPTVDFDLPDDPNGVTARGHVVCAEVDCIPIPPETTVTITGVVLDEPGSGYSSAPGAAILDGTRFDPVRPGGTGAAVAATLEITAIALDTIGSGYTAATVAITDATGLGAGALATASVEFGTISGIVVDAPGAGYVTPGGIRKFIDPLPGLCDPAGIAAIDCTDPSVGPKYIPLGVADPSNPYQDPGGPPSDTYEIALVQYRTSFSSDLPDTLVRGYVQIETAANFNVSQHFELTNELLDGTLVPVLDSQGNQVFGVTPPQYLGPTIVATKDRAVRIVFHNYLPIGEDGNLFLPVDTTIMGSGRGPVAMPEPTDDGTVMDDARNPLCGELSNAKDGCFTENRATLHLHGGITPWISDGTPHQWVTPANETTPWPEGVSVENVPDMDVCLADDDGCMTFYYTNQQSARLMFYHDHAWGITRLNVYAGEAAGYIITDATEQSLVGRGLIPGPADTIPLIIQDKTFVPGAAQLAFQDPTWDTSRWGGEGSLWEPHVYMPAQNPGDPGGMSAFGRWMYGPWFWPPATPPNGPIDNPYYDANCDPDVAEFCEPELIPGTPNISVGMEAFNDTPVVNGTAYPEVTLQPKSYRLRILNAANDRFWNLQWYVADATGTEVALNAAEVAAAQTDPTVFPTPDTALSPQGPSWIQIGTEGGFLPAPVVVPNQPTTWITDPTRFDVGNVDRHSLLLGPAERADTIVDFSRFAGQTLILYNDAPAAFPARVPSYDYYTGAPDLRPVGAPSILPGYGPNTRTIMRVHVADVPAATTFNLTALRSAFRHKANGTGVFEQGQNPIIVGQAAYNSAYGTSFAASSWCNAPGSTSTRCDGFVRISDQGSFGFNTLGAPTSRMVLPMQPKAIHDEMNSTAFDEYGRMQAFLGLEVLPADPGAQNVMLYPYVNPQTEIIDATNLPAGDVEITPIATADDGTQIWRITHNGVDTHPIHWHLYDVQVLNRVSWDNIVQPPEANELGWKDTLRVNPLQDTIVALRPIIPTLPFELPNSIRTLNPAMPEGETLGFNNVDANGTPTDPIVNSLVNFGWEYVFHCHILSHEEMDMMRPVSVALPPTAPTLDLAAIGATEVTLSWTDNSLTETAFLVQRLAGAGPWVTLETVSRPLDQPNTTGATLTYVDTTYEETGTYLYRIVAQNVVGYGGQFMQQAVESFSNVVTPTIPAAPTGLTATLQASPQVRLEWMDNDTNEDGFVIERAVDGGGFAPLPDAPAGPGTGPVVAFDTTVAAGHSYDYRVAATNAMGTSDWSNVASVVVPAVPVGPTGMTATLQAGLQMALSFTDNATNEDGFVIERAVDGGGFALFATPAAAPGTGVVNLAADTSVLPGHTYQYRVLALNLGGPSAWSTSASVVVPALPVGPTGMTATLQAGLQMALSFTDNATNEDGFVVERAVDGGGFALFATPAAAPGTGVVNLAADTSVLPGHTYQYRVLASNLGGPSAWSTSAGVAVSAPAAPTSLTATLQTGPRVALSFTDNATSESGFVVQRAIGTGAFSVIATLPARAGTGSVTYTDTAVTLGVTYRYRVRATDAAGVSAFSNTATVAVAAPAAPTSLTAVLQTGPQVALSFTDNATTETGFVVQRAIGTGAFSVIATLPARAGTGSVTYTDTAVTLGVTYRYRVRASNAAGVSAFSNIATVAVPTLPAAPTGLSATAQPGQVTLSWTDNATNETRFEIQRRTTGAWATIASPTSLAGTGPATFVDTTVTPGTLYRYRVRAVNLSGASAYSAVALITAM